MKHLLFACLLAALLLPATARADQCDVLLEWEIVFSLAHDEIVDYQTDDTLELDMRIRACEVYLTRIQAFLDEYPPYCDTQDNIKDLSQMRDNVEYIKGKLEEQTGTPSGRY